MSEWTALYSKALEEQGTRWLFGTNEPMVNGCTIFVANAGYRHPELWREES